MLHVFERFCETGLETQSSFSHKPHVYCTKGRSITVIEPDCGRTPKYKLTRGLIPSRQTQPSQIFHIRPDSGNVGKSTSGNCTLLNTYTHSVCLSGLSVKHQITYLLSVCLCVCLSVSLSLKGFTHPPPPLTLKLYQKTVRCSNDQYARR